MESYSLRQKKETEQERGEQERGDYELNFAHVVFILCLQYPHNTLCQAEKRVCETRGGGEGGGWSRF